MDPKLTIGLNKLHTYPYSSSKANDVSHESLNHISIPRCRADWIELE